MMDKQSVVYTYDGILLSLKKEGHSDTCSTWMNLEDMMPSEITELMLQSQKDKCCVIPLAGATERSQSYRDTSEMVVARG